MIIITLYALGWLLTGVLGAYLGHIFNNRTQQHTTLGMVAIGAIFGGICLLVVVWCITLDFLEDKKVFSKVIFKGKVK